MSIWCASKLTDHLGVAGAAGHHPRGDRLGPGRARLPRTDAREAAALAGGWTRTAALVRGLTPPWASQSPVATGPRHSPF